MKAVLAVACAASLVVCGCRPKAEGPCNSAFEQPLTNVSRLTAKCSPYTAPGDLRVDGTMTIEAGVELRMPPGSTMAIGVTTAGKLIVKGTKDKPVRITGEGWEGLQIGEKSAGSELEQLTIEHAALRIENAGVILKNVRVPSAKSTALELKMMGPMKAVKGLELGSSEPAEIIHASIAAIGALGAGEVTLPLGSMVTLSERLEVDGALHDIGAAFRLNESLHIDSTALGRPVALKIDQNVTIELAEKAALIVGSRAGPASLEINGTRQKPVTIRGGAGLQFFEFAAAPKLHGLVLEHTGSAARAAIYFDDARGLGSITDSVFAELPGEAIHVQSAKAPFTAFDHNTFRDVKGAALRMPISLANRLGPNNTFTNESRVVVDGDLENDITLAPLGVPYVVLGPVKIDGNDKGSITVTVQPGSAFLFDDMGKILVGKTSPAKWTAKGTPQQPITFGKLNKRWFGFEIVGRGALELENVVVSGIPAKIHPINFTSSDTSGLLKALTLKDVKLGIHACADKVKIENVTAPKGVKAVQSCTN